MCFMIRPQTVVDNHVLSPSPKTLLEGSEQDMVNSAVTFHCFLDIATKMC